MNWNDRYRTRRDAERKLRLMTPDDIPGVIHVVEQIGWSHQPADVARILNWSPEGCFLVEETGRGVIGTVSTVSYGTALAWIGLMMIAPDCQRQGVGRQLMRAALDHLIARDTERIMLDATDAGRPLYESLGFCNVCKVERWEGRASTYLGPRARRMRPADVDAVFDLDTHLFGLRRTFILMRLLEEFPDMAWVDYERGTLQGYLLGRRSKGGVILGPWMSWSPASAERLLLVALEALQGKNIVMDIVDSNGRAMILAGDHNLKRTGSHTRMIYGAAAPIAGEPLTEMAVTALATG